MLTFDKIEGEFDQPAIIRNEIHPRLDQIANVRHRRLDISKQLQHKSRRKNEPSIIESS